MKYEYWKEYETNGEKPDLPDDVEIRYYMPSAGRWSNSISTVGRVRWTKIGRGGDISKFRIVDERWKPKPNDWHERGELPPVGTGCEYIIGERRGYNKCTFVGLNSRGSIVIEDYNGEYKTYHSHQIKFRSLRTERDVLVEDMLSHDCEPQEGMLSRRDFCAALIDAGWRPIKQQVEDEFVDYGYGAFSNPEAARKAYRAGCRFVERGE